jgi:acyl-CoA thioesterase YciA
LQQSDAWGETPASLAFGVEGSMPDSGYVTDELHGPRGELASRVLAMPTDTNPKGDIFGGWIMSLMDMAGKMSATTAANGRVVTVAVDRIVFREPVKVGDVVCCYTHILRTGRTSITLSIEVWILRQGQGERVKVTDAVFTFVAIDDAGQPRAIAS